MAGPFIRFHRLSDGQPFIVNTEHIVAIDLDEQNRARIWVTPSTAKEGTLSPEESLEEVVTMLATLTEQQ